MKNIDIENATEAEIKKLVLEARKNFRLGKTYISRLAASHFPQSGEGPRAIFERMARLDFGELCREDCLANLEDICSGWGRIIGVYRAHTGEKVWCITQLCGEDTYTTIILPEEY